MGCGDSSSSRVDMFFVSRYGYKSRNQESEERYDRKEAEIKCLHQRKVKTEWKTSLVAVFEISHFPGHQE